MKSKIILAATIAAVSVSICACGRPDRKSSSDADGAKVTTATTERTKIGTRQTITPDTKEFGKYDDLSGLKGTFIETINGEKKNYIFVNGLGASMVAIGSKSPVPIGIITSKEGLMVYRGSKNPGDSFSPYTYDGTTLKFTAYEDNEYVWTKIDMLPIQGEYKALDDYGSYALWTFGSDGKLSIRDDKTTEMTFVQTPDKITVTDSNGKKTEYTYEYDEFSLSMKNGDQELYFRANI